MTQRPYYEVIVHYECPHCFGEGVVMPQPGDDDQSQMHTCLSCYGSGTYQDTIALSDALHDLKAQGKLP